MINNIKKLADIGIIRPNKIEKLYEVTKKYSLGISYEMLELIKKNKKNNPISKQFVPSLKELKTSTIENIDPIGDKKHTPVKGIVHRYPDRVLLKANSACAVYCRFCFRRETVGPSGENLNEVEIENAINYISKNPNIWEVILTGGDPFVLSPVKIKRILDKINKIKHIKIIRFHTRIPIVKPELITKELLRTLIDRNATIFVAIHINHALEITSKAKKACAMLVDAGIPLVGQTVLLRGINNKADILDNLFRTMLVSRITPYYLHHPDLAPGTGHFRVTIREGQKIMRKLRGRLSGIALPTYILDIPGGYGKIPLGPEYLSDLNEISHKVKDINGKIHTYPPE